ncbi:MAG TPA: PAS domain S-box protein [Candidatus Methylomirabilis sp.]|nr:PAS domain S-box protein [Candidatus Methylomirabilis sp.]
MHILVLHAHEANVPIFERTDKGLSAALQSAGVPTQNLSFEYLDLRGNPDPEYRGRLVEVLRVKYHHRKLDLIITLFPEALDFVLNEGRQLFPDVPIVALYLPAGVGPPRMDRRIIRHSVAFDMIGTLESALALVPNAKRVYVVSGTHELDRQYEDQARRDFKKWEDRLEFRYLSHMPLEEMLATASSAPPGTIIFFVSTIADITGKTYTSRDVVQRLSQTSTAPVFGLYDSLLGYGIAGGSLASFEDTGAQAGRLAQQILAGPKGLETTPPVLDIPPVPMFDWRQLKRWNLSVDAVPPGSILINREYTLWEQYHWQILVVLALITAQALTILVLLAHRKYRREAELTLRDSEERLRLAMSAATLGVWSWEIPRGRIGVSERGEGLLAETPAAEVTYTDFLAIVHPEDRDRVEAVIQQAIRARNDCEIEYRVPQPDGTVRWISSRGRCTYDRAGTPLRMAGVSHDITEGKRAGEERQLLAAVVESSHDAIYSLDPDDAITSWNPGAEQLFGYTAAEVKGQPVWFLVPPESREATSRALKKVRAGEAVSDFETVRRRKDGTDIHVSITGAPIRNSHGAIVGVTTTIRDITERKRAAGEADRLRRELAHMSRVSMMGELTASLAHELNQPLTAIVSNASAGERFLAAPVPPLGEVAEILADVAADAQRAGEVIRRLRSLLKNDTTRFLPLDLNEVIREVVALTQTDALIRHHPIELALAPGLPPVRGDRVQLQQVLLNLVLNGMEAMEAQPPAARRLRIQTLPAGPAVRVAVQDRGPGLPPEKLETVFDAFFTTKAQGMGMGLAISRSILEAHGGRIWAENNPEQGATFWFSLPV